MFTKLVVGVLVVSATTLLGAAPPAMGRTLSPVSIGVIPPLCC